MCQCQLFVGRLGRVAEMVLQELKVGWGGGGEGGLVQLAEGGSCRNVMVLSWLTPTNNEGVCVRARAYVCARMVCFQATN